MGKETFAVKWIETSIIIMPPNLAGLFYCLYPPLYASLDEVRGGVYQNLFNAKSLVNGKEDAASNYARGFYQMGQSYKEPFVDSLRKIAEACDLLNGLCFFHSYGGGTGSGLLMALEEHIDNSFIKQAKFDFGIYPSQQQVSSIVEPYNAILAASSPCRMESISLFFDNRSIIKVIRDRLKKDSISYTTMNRLLAQV
ncbi:unnamed protein product [Dibothriocephalus latus]|uniref:Tubulin/FtsZ GTPase domain-containing protein n=1 Tax=Dibothriocephalus latus TaxID=60516 RepID=A0A3P7LX37_DIBLA|nr:unnamed protein product [Dibothriocephalus latus]